MESSLKELRKFIIKEIINKNRKWSTEGRGEYYTTEDISIKKSFESGLWQFRLNHGGDNFFDLKSVGINKYFMYILLFFIKRNIDKQINIRKNEILLNTWNRFLANDKITKDIVYSRQMAKAHYPSDIKFGEKLAKKLFEYLKDNDLIH